MPSSRFLKFVLTGGTSAIFNLGSRVLFSQYLSFSQAVVLSYVVGIMVAYFLARRFVFQSSSATVRRSFTGFLVVNLWGVFQTLGISLLLLNFLAMFASKNAVSEFLSHFIALSSTVITSYLGHKYISFRVHE